ncbi:MAG: AMP-binding protein [Alphaproteobacteria bacterium]|jgi:1-acyl-sn-glycerol-3-phosphate acyltransferase|nr:AMP-binding protein [Alphaproteobacteria bacterium]
MMASSDTQGDSQEPGREGPTAETVRLLEAVRQLSQELHPHGPAVGTITLDSALDRDLGFDSLGRVELLSRLERDFDVTLPEQLIATADTPRDLLRALHGAQGRGHVPIARTAENLSLGEAAAPDGAQTLVDALQWHVERHPDRPHIRLYDDHDDGEVISYGELWAEAEKTAAGLLELGLGHGEAVVIMLATGRDYFSSFMGVLLAGGVPVPIYPPGRPSQIEEHLRRHMAIVDNCRAPIMIAMPEATRFTGLLRGLAATLRHVVTPEVLLAAPRAIPQFPRPRSDDIAFLQYTSGSTGAPKGVILTHANLLANIRAMGEALKVTSEDVFVSWLPLYHDMGLIGAWLGSLYYAVHLVIMPPLAFIARPRRWFQAIHRYRGTLSAAPNFAFELCLRRLQGEDLQGIDLSSWRVAANGAEAVHPATLEEFIGRYEKIGFRPESMMPVYGLAENSVGLAFPPLDRGARIDCIRRDHLMRSGDAVAADTADQHALRFVGCGHPLPRHQVRVVDNAGRELPDRQQGHLQFKGPSSTSGYLRAPDKTEAMFHGDWLDSEDLAYVAEGEIFITGRSKDIIIHAGRNLYPEEIETEVGKIDGVREGRVAVFGSHDPGTGTERLIVLAETRESDGERRTALGREINAVVTDLTGAPADDVVLAPPNTVLKTSSGKIRRAASREIYETGGIGKGQSAVWRQMLRLTLASLPPRLRRARQSIGAVLYGGYCWLVFALIAVPLWLILAVLPRPDWCWRLSHLCVRTAFRLSGLRLSVSGLEHLADGQVLVSNHQSYLDAFVMVAALPRRVAFVAKQELGGNVFTRLLLQRLGAELVERFDSTAGVRDAQRLAGVAGAGQPLLFFAEGTFERMPGLRPFRLGAFETALAAARPVAPMAIRGSRSVLRDGTWLPRRGVFRVIIGEAMVPAPAEAETDRGDFRAAIALRDQARAWILQHCGEPDLAHERPGLLIHDGAGPSSENSDE